MVDAEYPLVIDLAERDGRVIVSARGRLDWSTAVEFDRTMRDLSGLWDGSQVVLDLTEVDFIDLDGVDAVVRAGYRVRGSGPMTLRPPAVRRHILDLRAVAESYVIDLTDMPD